MVTKPTPHEYLLAAMDQLRYLVDWRNRWDQRTPEQEPELRSQWSQLVNRAEMLIAAPVEGEEDR